MAGISLESRAESFTERLGGLFKSVFYEAPPAAVQKEEPLSQGAQLPAGKEGSLLLVVRTDDQTIPEAPLKKLLQLFAAKSSNPNFKLVTIEDLVGTAQESLQGKAEAGGMQKFTSNEQVLQFALSQGIPGVLAVGVASLNVRPAKTAEGMFLGNAAGTVSLLSNGEASRLQSAEASASTRSFDEKQATDKLLQQLAANLAAQISQWKAPARGASANAACEIHAKVDGLMMPSFAIVEGVPKFQNQSIPVYASGATVELDGVMVGQTPCSVSAGKGMHKLKVTREGLKPVEAVVNLTGQNRFDLTLAPTEETLAKFNDQLASIRKLDQQQKINDADVKVLEGYAKMLRQSGYRIDQRKISDWWQLSKDKEDK